MDTNRKLATASVAIMCFSIINLLGMIVGYQSTDKNRAGSVSIPGFNHIGNIVNANGMSGNPGVLNLFYKFKLYSTYMLGIIFICAVACFAMTLNLCIRVKRPDSGVSKTDQRLILANVVLHAISGLILLCLFRVNIYSTNDSATAIGMLLAGVVITCLIQMGSLVCLLFANLL